MKYTIEGFSQEKMASLGLDAVDAVILRWFVDFYPDMKKIKEKDLEYGWVAYSHLSEDLPIIRISNREAMGRRFKRLCETNILIGIKANGNKTYFTFGSAYHDLVSSRLKSRKGTDLKVETLPTQKSDNPNTIDSSTNEKELELRSAHTRIISEYYKLFQDKAGTKPTIDGRVGKEIKELLELKPVEEVSMCLERYFNNGFFFNKKGYSFSNFRSHYDEVLSALASKVQEKKEGEEYKCPKCGLPPNGHYGFTPYCTQCKRECVPA